MLVLTRSKSLIPLLVASVLGGCGLPSSGPRGGDISNEAASAVVTDPQSDQRKFVLLDVSARTALGGGEPTPGSFRASLGGQGRNASEIRFGRGDVVQATIFEASSGGLFVSADAGSRPGNFVQLPPQNVDPSGNIKIPYAGSVRVVGRSAADVQNEIESRLKSKAIDPQVFVSTVTQRASEVAVLGDVNQAGKFAANPAGERVTDVISRAGGIKSPGYETYVTLQRNGRSAKMPFDRLVQVPAENIFVRPGDTVYVSRELRAYSVLGATGSQTRVPFPAERITLAEALGTGGGLVDTRANPGYVYLYRTEQRSLLQRMGADLSAFHPAQHAMPVIYKANLHEPASLFHARNFEMRDKDVIYVADADSVEVVKFFNVIQSITAPASQAAAAGYNVRRLGGN